MKSLQGQFLIAGPKLRDPNFFHTVVLMIQHNDDGAMGVVINRPLEATIASVWDQVSEMPCLTDSPLHHGGPCDGPLMVIHADREASQIEVLPGVHFTTTKYAIERLMADNQQPIKFFVGYAGWSPGQLENEIEQGAWTSTPASRDCVFAADDEDQWNKLQRHARASALGVNPAIIPDDPSMN